MNDMLKSALSTRAGATTTDVAERFRVCPETVRRWARSGRVPAFRAGAVLRFDLDEVEVALRVPAASASDDATDGGE